MLLASIHLQKQDVFIADFFFNSLAQFCFAPMWPQVNASCI